ncbi:MAG: hypothetical protein F6K04_05995 [Leptolyngbya sp. SIO4C5]|nr:hypothetical protein [Leptolyngbya sp. SIO4C5]
MGKKSMDGDRYAQFTEAYRNLNLFPLVKADEIERFRVAYGERVLLRLEQDLRIDKIDKTRIQAVLPIRGAWRMN